MNCNRLKWQDVVPRVDRKAGVHYLNPCLEDYSEHFKLQDDGKLLPLSKSAVYMVHNIDLNRDSLVRMRKMMLKCKREVQELREENIKLISLKVKALAMKGKSGGVKRVVDIINEGIQELEDKIKVNNDQIKLIGEKCLDDRKHTDKNEKLEFSIM